MIATKTELYRTAHKNKSKGMNYTSKLKGKTNWREAIKHDISEVTD